MFVQCIPSPHNSIILNFSMIASIQKLLPRTCNGCTYYQVSAPLHKQKKEDRHQRRCVCLFLAHKAQTIISIEPWLTHGNIIFWHAGNIIKCTTVKWGTRTLSLACNQAYPGSTMCVQNFDDSRGPAIRITYRISLRSSSLWEPWHPLLKVVHIKYKLGRGGAIQLPVSLNPTFPFDSGFLLYYCMAVVNWYLAQGMCRISKSPLCVLVLC